MSTAYHAPLYLIAIFVLTSLNVSVQFLFYAGQGISMHSSLEVGI